MVRCFLFCLLLLLPCLTAADDHLQALEEIARQRADLQPSLENYSARIVYDNVAGLLPGQPSDAALPDSPALIRYWQRGKPGLVAISPEQTVSSEQQHPLLFKELLSNGLEDALIPAGRSAERLRIAGQAEIKTADTILGQKLLKRIELTFAEPTSLQEAFYSSALPLPQEEITKLYLDIDAGTHTVQEVGLLTADGLKLTVEMRYDEIPGGFLPERVKITSPDGRIDDLFEVAYKEVDGFVLPAKFTQKTRRPGLHGDLVVAFEDYRINETFPADIQARLELLQ